MPEQKNTPSRAPVAPAAPAPKPASSPAKVPDVPGKKPQLDEKKDQDKSTLTSNTIEGVITDAAKEIGKRPEELLNKLKKLEVICASAHLYHNLTEEEQTKRLIRAITSGYVKILSHPTGRLINQRKAISFDMEAVFKACNDHHVALEINSSPDRMDLSDVHVRMAKNLGCKFSIDSDSHHSSQMGFLQYGVTVARRAGLQKEDIINTMSLKELLKYWKLK